MSIGDKHIPEIVDGVYCARLLEAEPRLQQEPVVLRHAHIVQ
jgi:hypothetical protein